MSPIMPIIACSADLSILPDPIPGPFFFSFPLFFSLSSPFLPSSPSPSLSLFLPSLPLFPSFSLLLFPLRSRCCFPPFASFALPFSFAAASALFPSFPPSPSPSVIRCCCWKPSSIRLSRHDLRRQRRISATPAAFAAPPGYTSRPRVQARLRPPPAGSRADCASPSLHPLRTGAPKILLTAEQMRTSPISSPTSPIPPRPGRRHPLPVVLAMPPRDPVRDARLQGHQPGPRDAAPRRARASAAPSTATTSSQRIVIRECSPLDPDTGPRPAPGTPLAASETVSPSTARPWQCLDEQGRQTHILASSAINQTLLRSKKWRPAHRGSPTRQQPTRSPWSSLLEASTSRQDLTTDALLTQRHSPRSARPSQAHYLFPSKPTSPPSSKPSRYPSRTDYPISRISPRPRPHRHRSIWTTTALNHYLDFPPLASLPHRAPPIIKKPASVPRFVLAHQPYPQTDAAGYCLSTQHWSIENSCHYTLDWN